MFIVSPLEALNQLITYCVDDLYKQTLSISSLSRPPFPRYLTQQFGKDAYKPQHFVFMSPATDMSYPINL